MRSSDDNSPGVSAFIGTTLLLLGYSQQGTAAAAVAGPAEIHAGPVAITPTLGSEAKYRSNIYLQEANETDSWIALLHPEIIARAQERENYYQLGYKGEAAWYDEDYPDNGNNYFDHTFSADANILYDEYWKFDVSGSYALLHEDRGTGLTEGQIGSEVDKPVEFDQADIGATVEYGSNRGLGRVKFEAGYMAREYQNFRELTRTRDRDETSLGLTFFYPVAPKTDIFAAYDYKDISYPNPFELLPPLDSEEYALTGGVEWEITPNLTSSARAGSLSKKFDNSARGDYSGLTWTLDLQMQLRDRDLVVITGSRGSEETNRQGDFIRREELKVRWIHDWSDRVATHLSGRIGNDSYKGSINGRDDDIYNVTLGIDYTFRRWANCYAKYLWDEKQSNIAGLSYTDNTFVIGVDFSL